MSFEGNEAQFRELEYQILMDLVKYTRVVVSTGRYCRSSLPLCSPASLRRSSPPGGGIVLKQENWGLLHHGIVVHLDLAVEDIHQRLSSDPAEIEKRPLLRETDPLAKLQQIAAARMDLYSQARRPLKELHGSVLT